MKYDEIWEQFRNTDDKRIILIGTDAVVSICHDVLMQFGCNDIEICDNSLNKQGQVFLGHLIVSPQEAISKDKENCVILCFLGQENEDTVYEQMKQLGVAHIYNKYPFIYWYYKYKKKREINYEKFMKSIEICEENNHEKNLVFETLTLAITEKCTLRCKDCAALTTQIMNPINYDTRQIIDSLKNLSENLDAIKVLCIMGGEALLATNLVEICREVSKIDNIHFIRIITNGTILPRAEVFDELEKYVDYFVMSDYGEISKRKNDFLQECEKRKMICDMRSTGMNWYGVDKIGSIARNEEEAWNQYRSCPFRCITLGRGKLFPCDFGVAAQSFELGYIEGTDYIDFETVDEKRNYREAIRNIIERKSAKTLCGTCTMNFNRIVQGAIQI